MLIIRETIGFKRSIVLFLLVLFVGVNGLSAVNSKESNLELSDLVQKNVLNADIVDSSSKKKERNRTPFATYLPWALLLGVFFVIKERNSGSRNANL